METILAAHQPPPGSTRQNQSPWLFLDAANTIFETAKRRVYTGRATGLSANGQIPDSLCPVLEEQPKWATLSEILDEIETDAYFNPTIRDDSNGTILIMCGDQSTCKQIRQYLQTKDAIQGLKDNPEENGEKKKDKPSAQLMLRRQLREYLAWKQNFGKVSAALFSENQKALDGFTDQRGANGMHRGKPPPNKRRRVRGGAAVASGPGRSTSDGYSLANEKEAQMNSLMQNVQPTTEESKQKDEIVIDDLDDIEDYFNLLSMDDLVVVHPFDGDMDEQILEELRPRYIIMYEPDAAFIRRVEVYRSSHSDRNVRVYFMFYGNSVEEQRYLSAVRKEKDAFTKLIHERGVRKP